MFDIVIIGAGVVGGMIAHRVPLIPHSTDKIGVLINQICKDEKRGANVLFLQYVQNLFDISVFISRIKGQINDLITARIICRTVNKNCIQLLNKGELGRN